MMISHITGFCLAELMYLVKSVLFWHFTMETEEAADIPHRKYRQLSYTISGDDSSWYPQTAIRNARWRIGAPSSARQT
jgi:hypothetical protein